MQSPTTMVSNVEISKQFERYCQTLNLLIDSKDQELSAALTILSLYQFKQLQLLAKQQ